MKHLYKNMDAWHWSMSQRKDEVDTCRSRQTHWLRVHFPATYRFYWLPARQFRWLVINCQNSDSIVTLKNLPAQNKRLSYNSHKTDKQSKKWQFAKCKNLQSKKFCKMKNFGRWKDLEWEKWREEKLASFCQKRNEWKETFVRGWITAWEMIKRVSARRSW